MPTFCLPRTTTSPAAGRYPTALGSVSPCSLHFSSFDSGSVSNGPGFSAECLDLTIRHSSHQYKGVLERNPKPMERAASPIRILQNDQSPVARENPERPPRDLIRNPYITVLDVIIAIGQLGE